MSAIQTLVEMGFSENSAKRAVAVTKGGVEQAMEWLLAHADDPGINDPPTEAEAPPDQELGKSDEDKDGTAGSASTSDPKENEEEAKSIKCDVCSKLFKTPEEVEFHAVKSGHSSFSESSEEKKPLSEEEKQQKKKELQEKIRQRRKARELEDEKNSIELEKKRIQMGQEIAERKRIMQEMEMKRIVEDRKKEKMEDKLARQKIKEQIERDKLARKEMFASKTEVKTKEVASTSQPAPTAIPTEKKQYNTARLQIRLPSGTPMVKEFHSKEPLSAVRLWVSLNRQDGEPVDTPFKLSTSFPRKVFTDEDMDKPLDVLGLVPSSVLMVTK